MKSLVCYALSSLALTSLALAGDHRLIEASHELVPGQSVYIDFNSGSLDVESTRGERVEIELELKCKWNAKDCEELLEDVELDWSSSERRLTLRVEGLASWRRAKVEFDATVRVPAAAPLNIDMGAGRLEVDGRAADLRIDMGAGELRVWMEESAIDSVSLDVGVGDAQLRGSNERVSGRRAMLVGSEIYWDEGGGTAIVDVELGVGEATLYLD